MHQWRSLKNAAVEMTQNRKAMTIIGDVNDKDVILVDDEIDTGGSMVQAVNIAKDIRRQGYLHGLYPCRS